MTTGARAELHKSHFTPPPPPLSSSPSPPRRHPSMETNIQLTPPPPASAIAVAREAKRARRRSRYLSAPYTDTDTDDDDGVQEEEEPPPNVCAADVLSALHAAALPDLDSTGPSAAQVDAPALRFLALYRRRVSTSFANPPSDSAGSRNLSAGPAIPMAHGSPAPGSALAKKRKNPQAAAATKQQDDAMENAAALEEAAHKMKMASQADFFINAANGERRKKKKMKEEEQAQHFRNPVALVLDFAEGTPLPSKDELLSTFRRFGLVIHSDSEPAIARGERSASARVVFATRAEAEAAYRCAKTLFLGAARLQDLPPITLNVPKLPLTDIRKNLEMMISSASFKAANSPEEAKPAMGNLVAEMQGLLAKVDKMLKGASSTAHHH
ncbi:uncharacterized protein LOC133928227 [Phragmites australis]|uniref:uncharacterized protein LOC133928227 n=1 Tax=Phragmites australis TaxID=29695 RepID=UPI002D76F971|nr:uncharacterized protein LOC133928227 [Phragmites australis]